MWIAVFVYVDCGIFRIQCKSMRTWKQFQEFATTTQCIWFHWIWNVRLETPHVNNVYIIYFKWHGFNFSINKFFENSLHFFDRFFFLHSISVRSGIRWKLEVQNRRKQYEALNERITTNHLLCYIFYFIDLHKQTIELKKKKLHF